MGVLPVTKICQSQKAYCGSAEIAVRHPTPICFVCFSLFKMKTSSIFSNLSGAVVLSGIALMTSVWAVSGATIDNSDTAATQATVVAQPKRSLNIVYPYEMLVDGKTGWADASFIVDYAGKPLFANPVGASDAAFAKAAVAMVEANVFAPAKKEKHSTMAATSLHFKFDGETSLSGEARRVLAELRKAQPAIYNLADLDQRPKAVSQDSPVYPRALKDDGITGQAEIEFVVAADGSVQFPRIVSATQEDFGWAAAIAVAQWRFQSPTKNGQKVDVRMTVPVLFDARKLAAAD